MSFRLEYEGDEINELLDKAKTALQKEDISHLASEDYVTDELGKLKDSIPSKVSELDNDSGYLTEHQSLEHLATKEELEDKVDKVDGKQLSAEDFTRELKAKLEGLKNYDDAELVSRIDAIQETIDTLFSKDATSAIESFNEIIAFLEGIEDSQNLDSIIASIEQQIADVAKIIPSKVSELENDKGYLTEHQDVSHLATREELTSGLAAKQDEITDLKEIRSGAAKGATALQSYTEKYTGTYNKPSTGIPKSDLASGVQTSLGKADTALQSIPDTYATKTNLAEALAPIGTLYIGAWTATKTEGISQLYTERITVPAGTYIISVVLPYAKMGHGNQICIGFTAKMAIGTGNTFLDASYGCTTQLATFTTATSIGVMSAASANSAEWDYLDRGGIAALRIK